MSALAIVIPLFFIAFKLDRIGDILARIDRREHYKQQGEA
jgi:hypothetical protein